MAIDRRLAQRALLSTLGYILGRAIYCTVSPTNWRTGSVMEEGAVFLVTFCWLQSSGARALFTRFKRRLRRATAG
ncbi:MAG TPA: hypothetical protein VMU19_01800 [Bryobacteraceae bacterium]|nr:hypothetical protein [Bryobacteraceae bacterium]